MDVLVKWSDGTSNVVSAKELVSMKKGQKFEVGAKVKMLYDGKWYYGVVKGLEDSEQTSSDDEPLSTLVRKHNNSQSGESHHLSQTIKETHTTPPINRTSPSPLHSLENQNRAPGAADEYIAQTFEVLSCIQEVFSSCFRCNCLLCWEHFNEDTTSCIMHVNSAENIPLSALPLPVESSNGEFIQEHSIQGCEYQSCHDKVFSTCFQCSCLLCWKHFQTETTSCSDHKKGVIISATSSEEVHTLLPEIVPENYEVEGESRQYVMEKPERVNKFKKAKKLRAEGKEYTSPYTKKVVASRELKSSCNFENCKKNGRQCHLFSDDLRENIFIAYYSLGDLSLQREYIVRFTEKVEVKQRTVGAASRRKNTYIFYLPLGDGKLKVCRTLFLNTLGISERSLRTAITKKQETGVLEKERRGGRHASYLERDMRVNNLVRNHINRFPRVESHYCRANSTRQYLHEDLSLKKMYSMFLNDCNEPASFSLYRKIFKSMNLSFHRPKKDQCSLCNTYRQGSEETRNNLSERYTQHIAEKKEVRKIKEACKKLAQQNKDAFCASFDLQQVIYLPQSKESSLFYRRRLANYNFTIYDLSSNDCFCYFWNEVISKRGASEICTALKMFLTDYDNCNLNKYAFLFSDGCTGQNKNSMVAAMLLHFINSSENIVEIKLRFFCPSHGQSEGDSALQSLIPFQRQEIFLYQANLNR